MRQVKLLVAAALPLALVACKGDDSEGSATVNKYCRTIPSAATLTCTGAAGGVEDCELALDKNFGTGAAQQANSQVVYDGTFDRRDGGTLAGVYLFGPSTGTITVSVAATTGGNTQDAGTTQSYNYASTGNTGCS